MASIKCRMCGEDLRVVEGSRVAECEFCGAKQAVPSVEDEKALRLFGRAGRLLRACEFDKAAEVFESILADFPEEAEAYWGLVLCKYGVEYADDPATGRKIPACRRASFDGVMDDENFEQACENADAAARKLYREEAKAIEALRRGIVEISRGEAPYDIFLCCLETDEDGVPTPDSALAQEIYDALTARGYRVFFSRVPLADERERDREPYIFAALNSAQVMLVIGTDYDHFDAVWVKNEWSRFLQRIASGQRKALIPCYRGIDVYDMPKEFAKLPARDLGEPGAMRALLRDVDERMAWCRQADESAPEQATEQQATSSQATARQAAKPQAAEPQAAGDPSADSLFRRAMIFLEDGEWKKASEYFDKVLDMEPENARAYFGMLLAAREAKDAQALVKQEREIADDPLFQRALRYADAAYKAELNELEASVRQAIRNAQIQQQEMQRTRRERLKPLIERSALAGRYLVAWGKHTIGLKSDGTAVQAPTENPSSHYKVSDWTDIIAVAAGGNHCAGLKSYGEVVISGYDYYYDVECKVDDWRDIVAVTSGERNVMGVKKDGTVVMTGNSYSYYRSQIESWEHIVAVCEGYDFIMGLKSDGTVVAAGKSNSFGECDVSDWTDIVAIAAGNRHSLGLKSDGTVVAAGSNEFGRCDVSGWTDIVAIAAGVDFSLGLKSDGTVVAIGNGHYGQCDVSSWTNIVAIAAGDHHSVGLKSDGTVVATKIRKNTDVGQCNVSDWKLFDSIDTLKEDAEALLEAGREYLREVARKAAEEERRQKHIENLRRERDSLKEELAKLSGLFTGKRRREIETRLSEIDRELSQLK